MTSCLVTINMLVVRIVFAENYYLRVWLEKALSLDFIKGNQTVLSIVLACFLSEPRTHYLRFMCASNTPFLLPFSIIYRLINILLLLQLFLTIEILGECYCDQDCDASYYASSNIVSSYWLTFWESEKTEQTDYFRSLAIKKTVRSNNTNSCTDQIQGPRKTVHI